MGLLNIAIALHLASHAALLSSPSLSSGRQLLRLRGGEDADGLGDTEENGPVPDIRVLTRDECTRKLNEVPTFCVTNEAGQVAMMRIMKDGLQTVQAVCFFTEAAEAQAALKAMTEAKPDGPALRLSFHGLGTAFGHCQGWEALEADAEAGSSNGDDASVAPEMRLMGPYALVNHTQSALTEMLTAENIEPGCWTMPIFICDQLQSKSVYPCFLRPSDLKQVWMGAGRTEESLPEDIQVLDLRMLVKQMRTVEKDWSRVHLVAPTEAVELVQQLAQRQ